MEIGPGGTTDPVEGVVNFYQKDTGLGTEIATYWEFIDGKYVARRGINLIIKSGQSPFVCYIDPNYARKRIEGYFVHGTKAGIGIDNFIAITFTQTDIPSVRVNIPTSEIL